MFNATSSNDEVNSTSSNDEVIDSVIKITVFLFITLPASVLSGLCVVAILIAKAINLPMRVLLLNIFASLFTLLFSRSLFLLIPSTQVLENDFSCKLTYTVGIIGVIMENCSIAQYAVMVYVFVKYSRNKLKWYVLIPFITISWTITILLGSIPFIQDWEFTDNCRILHRDSSLPLPNTTVLIWLFQITGWVVISTFGILTYCYIKHNTLQEDNQIKKAIAKSLFYLVGKTVLTVITYVPPTIIPIIRSFSSTTTIKVLFYFGLLLVQLPGIFTLILMLVALEPLRKAMKQIKKKLLSCCKTNVVHPSNST